MKNSSSEPTQRLNVDLPKSQYFALKSYALHNDTTVSQLVRDSLQEVVDYDTWFKARVHTALNDPRPSIAPQEWDEIRAAKLAQRAALKASA
jgi:hypothetical protein